MAKTKAKSKWGTAKNGTAVKLAGGGRIVQRIPADGGEPIWYHETPDLRRVSLGVTDRKTAQQKALSEPAGPKEDPAPRTFLKPKAPGALTLEKAFETYRAWYEKKYKPSGCAVTLPTVEKFVDAVGAEYDTRVITRDHVQAFVDRYEDHSPIYVRNEYARIRAFLRWVDSKNDGAVNLAAVKGIELPKVKGVAAVMPPLETVRALLRRLSSHPMLGDYCTALFEIGCRPGELLAVRGVDLRDDLLDIRTRADWSPKNEHSERTIQLSPAAASILQARVEKMFDKKFPIFGLPTGKIRNAKDVGKQYREAMKVDGEIPAALSDFNLYMLRHAFASFHAKTKIGKEPNPAFMTLPDLGKYMGHSPSSTHTLERWYVDRQAEDLGSPGSLTVETKDGEVLEMKKKSV
jgi:integrase